jgi:hypothetical protein
MTTAPVSLQDLRRRIYGKAKAEKTKRFWGLYVHVAKLETLRAAYEIAKKHHGAPGIDGVTFEAIEAGGVEGFLAQLREELVSRTYRPLRNRRVEIPKRGGKVRAACGTGGSPGARGCRFARGCASPRRESGREPTSIRARTKRADAHGSGARAPECSRLGNSPCRRLLDTRHGVPACAAMAYPEIDARARRAGGRDRHLTCDAHRPRLHARRGTADADARS